MTRVAIVGGLRTPFVKAGGVFSQFSFLELGRHVVEGLVSRLNLRGEDIEEFIFSTVLLDPRTPNAARELILQSALPDSINAHFISNNCISGLVAAGMLSEGIKSGRVSTGIAGGSESMSRPTLTLKKSAEKKFIKLNSAKSMGDRLKIISSLRPGHFLPVPPSPKEPSTGLTMGEHCELMAKEFSIERKAQDEIALLSHQRAAAASDSGHFSDEILELGGVNKDNLVRPDTSLEKLESLKPVFDRENGTLTAGNSSPLTDGASAVCLMAEERAKVLGFPILGYLERVEYAAIKPADGLLMAPAIAVPRLLEKSNLRISDIDYFEVHEAFAAQVLANQKAWREGWSKYPNAKPIGEIPGNKMNVNGGSVAIGHPFAATGGRLIISLCHQLQRSGGSRGVISVCAASGMAGAMLISRE